LRALLRALWPGKSRRVYVHVHIPRCAGSSLHAELFDCFPARHVLEHHSASLPDLSGLALDRPTLVTGHFPCVEVPDDGREYRYLVLLRDPVERTLSLFDYITQTPSHRLHRRYVDGQYTLLDAIDDTSNSLQFRDGQIRNLLGHEAFGFGEVDESGCRSALALLSRPDVLVGLTDDYTDFVQRVRDDLAASGWRLSARARTPVRINGATRPGIGIDPAIMQAIRHANRWDTALVDQLLLLRPTLR
jgi:hypothetical protein